MGLDMSFFRSEKHLKLNQINNAPKIDWDSLPLEEVFYFRRYWDLHKEIFRIYEEKFPGELEKRELGDNCMLIELELDMLEKLENWAYEQLKTPESENFDCRLNDFYPVLCSMIFRTKHGEMFYYEGDY